MITIRLLNNEWQFDENSPLGRPGGFGAVFLGAGSGYDSVAVKRLHLSANDAAHRELRIANELMNRNLNHVIPVLDSGKDANSDYYFIVMLRAEKSLQQELSSVGKFSERDAVDIVKQIAEGLIEVKDLVHRDLKPGNILYHNGNWKVADFGIARFVEDSTSLNTLKTFLSAPFAAPEQWRLERASSATDVYALGCILYVLLSGNRPFNGPEREDYMRQHLQQEPTPLPDEINPRLRSLVANMLRKPSQARPNLERVLNVLSEWEQANSRNEGTGFRNLAIVGAVDSEALVRSDATKAALEEEQRARKELFDTAVQILNEIKIIFTERVQLVAPTAQAEKAGIIRLGQAYLEISSPSTVAKESFSNSGWDVIAKAEIRVAQNFPHRSYIWSANLWFTNLGQGSEYRWWEVSYMTLSRHSNRFEPFALDTHELNDADLAASPIMHIIQFASKPRPMDGEHIDDFCERWAELLAKAYRGELQHPPRLPLD